MRIIDIRIVALLLLSSLVILPACSSESSSQQAGSTSLRSYQESARAIIQELDDVESILAPLMNQATFDPPSAQSSSWQQQFSAQVARANGLLDRWKRLHPPESALTYHQALGSYLENLDSQYQLLYDGIRTRDAAMINEGLILRENSRTILVELGETVGVTRPVASEEEQFRAKVRSTSTGLREAEVEFARLITQVQEMPAVTGAWIAEMNSLAARVESISVEWDAVVPSHAWDRYHVLMSEYMELMQASVVKVMDGFRYDDDARLSEADQLLNMLEAKRLQIVNEVSSLTP